MIINLAFLKIESCGGEIHYVNPLDISDIIFGNKGSTIITLKNGKSISIPAIKEDKFKDILSKNEINWRLIEIK